MTSGRVVGADAAHRHPPQDSLSSRRRHRSSSDLARSLDRPMMTLSQAAAPSPFRYVAAGASFSLECPTMPRSDEQIRPMTLGNMRSIGVRGRRTDRRDGGTEAGTAERV